MAYDNEVLFIDGSNILSPNEDAAGSIFKQYEQVLIESIISSFGLNFIMRDQHGGDVDTVHNVRKIENDPSLHYKSKKNERKYMERGEYNSTSYHSHQIYKNVNRENSELKDQGILKNAYSGKNFKRNDRVDLDHVVAAKEIHDDHGRVLSGMKGEVLANTRSNLQAADMSTNRSKKAMPMEEFLIKNHDKYSENEKKLMMEKDRDARTKYNREISKTYYSSAQFASDITRTAAKSAFKMGIKEVMGFIFAEIWFELKSVFQHCSKPLEFRNLLHDIGDGVRRGFENAKLKYKSLMQKLKDGALSGFFSSIITTICNIFFTTAKNVVKIIREGFSSLVNAVKVLFINPDNLGPEAKLKSVMKILSVGASIIVGSLVSQAISSTVVGQTPVIGDIIQVFTGSFVIGVMSCSLLWFFDKSELMNKIYGFIRNKDFKNESKSDYDEIEKALEVYAAELLSIDVQAFRRETEAFEDLSKQLEQAKDDKAINTYLKEFINKIGLDIPWEGSFDSFMSDKSKVLYFD